MTKYTDTSPEELRAPLLAAIKPHVPFDGWSEKSLRAASSDLGITPEMAELAFPGGLGDLLTFYFQTNDRALEARLEAEDLPALKIRDRITRALQIKLEMNAAERELVGRTVPTALLPPYSAIAAKALWSTCDVIWRAAGDTATDYNHYTKRATLAAVYSSVLLYWLNDDSEGYTETLAFLDRRIANVMQFEKMKFELRKSREQWPSLSRFLSKLRYPEAGR